MTLNLIDLGHVVAIVTGSMGSVLAIFQLVRNLFLDRLTQALDDTQRDTLYRTLVYLALVIMLVVLALGNGYTLSVALVVTAGVSAFPMLAGVHFTYTRLQKYTAASAPRSPAPTDQAPTA